MTSIEPRIAEWRAHIERGRTITAEDAAELESHLRDRIDELRAAGLDDEEAFLVAVRRMGAVDALTHEFARAHSGRLWKQLVIGGPSEPGRRSGVWVMLAFAVGAAAAITILRLATGWPDSESGPQIAGLPIAPDAGARFGLNAGAIVLAFLAAWLAVRRRLAVLPTLIVAAAFVVSILAVNLYPFPDGSQTLLLTMVHLPIALWFVVGIAYLGGRTGIERRMDFVRFTGELIVYLSLIALGAIVLILSASMLLEPFVPGFTQEFTKWIIPAGVAASVLIAAWLVEAKQSIIENIAPVLTAIFTPLFAALLVVCVVVYFALGAWTSFDRELLGSFDALLVVVLGLVLYGLSARDEAKRRSWLDALPVVATAAALLLDGLVLGSMIARIGDYGFTPNRAAALGLNVVLFAALAGALIQLVRFLLGRAPITGATRWLMGYLPVFLAWAATVALAFPLIFTMR